MGILVSRYKVEVDQHHVSYMMGGGPIHWNIQPQACPAVLIHMDPYSAHTPKDYGSGLWMLHSYTIWMTIKSFWDTADVHQWLTKPTQKATAFHPPQRLIAWMHSTDEIAAKLTPYVISIIEYHERRQSLQVPTFLAFWHAASSDNKMRWRSRRCWWSCWSWNKDEVSVSVFCLLSRHFQPLVSEWM